MGADRGHPEARGEGCSGHAEAGVSQDLLGRVYQQLRAAAQREMNAERAGHTLSATVLVHEAYLRLKKSDGSAWQSEAQYYAAAAQAMRRILIDHARARIAGKRGGAEARRAALSLSNLPDPTSERDCAGFLILDDAISRLGGVDPQAATVVRLRYFAGLSVEETARAMSVSEPTVKRAWTFARAWLKDAIERDA